jgi:hypothetical protein
MNAQHLLKSMATGALVAMAAVPLAAQEPVQEQLGADQAATRHEAVLRVTNESWLDMHVYVSRDGGLRRSIGVVGSFQSVELPLPVGALDPGARVRLVADPIGSSGVYVSPEIFAGAGDDVILTIRNSLPLSFLTVQRRPGG